MLPLWMQQPPVQAEVAQQGAQPSPPGSAPEPSARAKLAAAKSLPQMLEHQPPSADAQLPGPPEACSQLRAAVPGPQSGPAVWAGARFAAAPGPGPEQLVLRPVQLPAALAWPGAVPCWPLAWEPRPPPDVAECCGPVLRPASARGSP
jgi:hypothetical protein